MGTEVPSRLARSQPFARLFRNYLGVWCLLVAASPIAVTGFGLLPIYESQKSTVTASAVFFCLLGLAYVFNLRHRLAATMFATRLLWREGDRTPATTSRSAPISLALVCMIVGALTSAAVYLWAFESGRASATFPRLPPHSANAVLLVVSYTTMFLLAEAAFAIMAVREYLQDVLGLTDAEVITGVPRLEDGIEVLATIRRPIEEVASFRSETRAPR